MEYFKKLICKLFGHVHVEEMYAAPLVVERIYPLKGVNQCHVQSCFRVVGLSNQNQYGFHVRIQSINKLILGLNDDES